MGQQLARSRPDLDNPCLSEESKISGFTKVKGATQKNKIKKKKQGNEGNKGNLTSKTRKGTKHNYSTI